MNTPRQNASKPTSTAPTGGSASGYWSSRYYDSLYQIERRWAGTLLSERRPFMIYGGRGLGKSPTMQWIRDELIVKREKYRALDAPAAEEEGDDSQHGTYLCIAGKATDKGPKTPYETLRDAAHRDSPPTAVLIDDVDQILEHAKRSHTEARAVSGAIKELRDNLHRFMPPDGERQLILSATEDVHEPRFDEPELRREEEQWSRVFAQIQRKQLNPWHSLTWQEELRELVHELLNPTSSSHGSTLSEAVQATLADVVPGIIVDLSGGHPKLTGQLLDSLEEFWRKGQDLQEPLEVKLVELCALPSGHQTELRELLRRYLEDRLVRSPRGLRSLRRSLQRLREQHDLSPEAGKAFSELLRIARSRERGDDAPRDADIRLQLTALGLVYEDPNTLRYVVPGTVIQGEVLRHQVEDTPRTEAKQPLTLSPSPKNPREEGVLAVNRPDGERMQVPLDGKNWQILTALDQRRGQVISIPDLATELQAHDAATRSALRRLRDKLDEYGIESILDNQWGKGYRLIEPS